MLVGDTITVRAHKFCLGRIPIAEILVSSAINYLHTHKTEHSEVKVDLIAYFGICVFLFGVPFSVT